MYVFNEPGLKTSRLFSLSYTILSLYYIARLYPWATRSPVICYIFKWACVYVYRSSLLFNVPHVMTHRFYDLYCVLMSKCSNFLFYNGNIINKNGMISSLKDFCSDKKSLTTPYFYTFVWPRVYYKTLCLVTPYEASPTFYIRKSHCYLQKKLLKKTKKVLHHIISIGQVLPRCEISMNYYKEEKWHSCNVKLC